MGAGKDIDDIKEWVQDIFQTFGKDKENYLSKEESKIFFSETLKLAGLELSFSD